MNWSGVAVTSHEALPVHGPLHPEKTDPEEATALRLTAVPAANLPVQDVPQSMPAGLFFPRPLLSPPRNRGGVGGAQPPPPQMPRIFPFPPFSTKPGWLLH